MNEYVSRRIKIMMVEQTFFGFVSIHQEDEEEVAARQRGGDGEDDGDDEEREREIFQKFLCVLF